MSTPPQNPAGHTPGPRSDDPTRDIRLPSLPDRPPAVVRPEWQAHVRPTVADPSPAPAPVVQPEPVSGNASDATAAVPAGSSPELAPARPYVLPNEPTDKLASAPQVRQQTRAFDTPPEAGPAPWVAHDPGPPGPGQGSLQFATPPFEPPSSAAPGHGTPSHEAAAPDRPRRWPWVVLTVLPILVIVVSGLLLVYLLRGA